MDITFLSQCNSFQLAKHGAAVYGAEVTLRIHSLAATRQQPFLGLRTDPGSGFQTLDPHPGSTVSYSRFSSYPNLGVRKSRFQSDVYRRFYRSVVLGDFCANDQDSDCHTIFLGISLLQLLMCRASYLSVITPTILCLQHNFASWTTQAPSSSVPHAVYCAQLEAISFLTWEAFPGQIIISQTFVLHSFGRIMLHVTHHSEASTSSVDGDKRLQQRVITCFSHYPSLLRFFNHTDPTKCFAFHINSTRGDNSISYLFYILLITAKHRRLWK